MAIRHPEEGSKAELLTGRDEAVVREVKPESAGLVRAVNTE